MNQNVFSKKAGPVVNLLQSLPKNRDPTKPIRINFTNTPSQPTIPPFSFSSQSKQDLNPQPSTILQNHLTIKKLQTSSSTKQPLPIPKSNHKPNQPKHTINPPNIQTQPPLTANLAKIDIISQTIKSLKLLYQIIRGNNTQLLMKINNMASSVRKNHTYCLRKDELNRLQQGLSFYQRSTTNHHSKSHKILTLCLQKHIFSPLITKISQHYNLEPLKSFYLIKEIHKRNKIITQPQSFFINLKRSQQMIKQTEVIRQCDLFLQEDKKSLILCYMEIYRNQSPSKFRVVNRSEEYAILIRNFNMVILKQTSIQLKHLFINFFELFWQKSPQKQHTSTTSSFSSSSSSSSKSQLNLLRNQLINLPNPEIHLGYRSKLYNLNIDEDLQNNTLQVNLLSQSLQCLYYTLVQRVDDYVQKGLEFKVMKLSIKWGRYIESYLQKQVGQFNESKSKGIDLKKAVYIFNILKSYKQNHGIIPLNLLENYLILILNHCSLPLSILFLSQFQIQTKYSYYMTNIINKYHQAYLQTKLQQQISTLTNLHLDQQKIDLELIVRRQLSIVKRVMKGYIKMDDFMGLEMELMNYGVRHVFLFNFEVEDGQDQLKFNCIKYYINMLDKLPSMHTQIHLDALQILSDLKTKNHNIKLTLQDFTNNIINRTLNISIIQTNISALTTLSQSQTFIIFAINQWLNKMERYDMVKEMVGFQRVLCVVCERLVEFQGRGYVGVLKRAIVMFDEKIEECLRAGGSQVLNKLCQIYLWLKRVEEWSSTTQIQFPQIITLLKHINHYLSSQTTLLQILQSSQIDNLLKIYLYAQFINEYMLIHKTDQPIKTLILQLQPTNLTSLPKLIDTLSLISKKHKTIFSHIINTTIFELYRLINAGVNKICEYNVRKILEIAIEIGRKGTLCKDGLVRIQADFIKLVHLYTIRKYKDKVIGINLYSIIIHLLSICKYMIQYDHHLYWLKVGLKQPQPHRQSQPQHNLLTHLIIQDQPHFTGYSEYIISLTLVKNQQRKLQFKGEFDIKFYLKLFNIIIEKVLRFNWSLINIQYQKQTGRDDDRVDPCYMLEGNIKWLTFFYLQIIKKSNLTELVLPYLNKLQQLIKHLIQAHPSLTQSLQSYLTKLQYQLTNPTPSKSHLSHPPLNSQRYNLAYNDKAEWQQKINKLLWQLVHLNHQQYLDSYQLIHKNIRQIIEVNSKFKISRIMVNSSILLMMSNSNGKMTMIDEKYGQYYMNTLQLTNFIIKNKQLGTNIKDLTKPFPYIFQPITPLLKTLKLTSTQTIITITSILSTLTYILRSNMTSALHLTRKEYMSSNIASLINEISTLLFKWQSMPKDILKDNKMIWQIDFQWQFMQRNSTFCLWNLVEYNLKFKMIKQMLILLKLSNGLLQRNSQFKTTIIQFLKLITIKKSQLPLAIQLNKHRLKSYEHVYMMNKIEMEGMVYEIVYHLEAAFGEMEYQEIMDLKDWEKEMYVCR